MTIDKQYLRDIVNAEVTDDSARIELHRAINAWQEPAKALNLEQRIDAAAVWLAGFSVHPVEGAGWVASLSTDPIGNGSVTAQRSADSPADALSLALADAAEWVTKQRDIR